jgi:hypothetical protein
MTAMLNTPSWARQTPVVRPRAENLAEAYPATPEGLRLFEADVDRCGGIASLAAIYGVSRQAAWALLNRRRRGGVVAGRARIAG